MSDIWSVLPRPARNALGTLRWHAQRMPERLVERGLPAAALGWRWVPRETPAAYAARAGGSGETVHAARSFGNPLPANVGDREALDPDPGWWGYAMRDVPDRLARATEIWTLPECRIVAFHDARGQFNPAVLTRDGRALDLPQSIFRPDHARLLRAGAEPVRRERAVWVLERVWHNHSHWLTSHLPKLLLLRSLGRLDDLILPAGRSRAIDDSLRMLGLDPEAFPTFDAGRPLDIRELIIVTADRFRPELLRALRDAVAAPHRAPWRRVLISRAEARGRRLLDEDRLWPELQRRGFERVVMERLDFAAQVRLMQETSVLLAPHGAGLTNMIFCPEGADIFEIADPAYPNPNFYALATAMGHRYWLLHADGVGAGHALTRDLRIDRAAVLDALDPAGCGRAGIGPGGQAALQREAG